MFGITKVWLTSRERDACETVTRLVLETGSRANKRIARRLARTWKARSGTDNYFAMNQTWQSLSVWLDQFTEYLKTVEGQLTAAEKDLLLSASEALSRISSRRGGLLPSMPRLPELPIRRRSRAR
jgi:hypothetical protein